MRLLACVAVLGLAAVALAGCGSRGPAQTPADGDADGLSDFEEATGWGIHIMTRNGTVPRDVASDPGNGFTDGSLPDRYKFLLGLDPHAQDTDGDGLTDCQEVYDTHLDLCNDPTQRDWLATHHDGGYKTVPNKWDTDLDGLADGEEVNGITVPLPGGPRLLHTDPLMADGDHDGLTDGAEARTFRTDPTLGDTDGDQCGDGLDVLPRTPNAQLTLGLGDFTPQGNGTMHVRVVAQVSGTPTSGGGASGVAVQAGRANDLAGVGVAAVTLACGISPRVPWISVSFQVSRLDPGPASLLDLTSGSNPDGSVQVYWNPYDGTYSWDGAGGAPFAGPLRWQGNDGAIAFHPLLVPGQAT